MLQCHSRVSVSSPVILGRAFLLLSFSGERSENRESLCNRNADEILGLKLTFHPRMTATGKAGLRMTIAGFIPAFLLRFINEGI